MKNIFQKIKEQQAAEERKRAEEQRFREERLHQLETEQHKTGLHVLHPVKTLKTKREIKSLREEIAAYEKQKQNKKTILKVVCALAVACCLAGIMAIVEHFSDNSTLSSSSVAASTTSSFSTNLKDSDEKATSSSVSETVTTHSEPSNQTIFVESSEAPASESKTDSEAINDAGVSEPVSVEANSHFTASDLTVYTISDYAHVDRDSIVLGQKEGVTITIKTSLSGITKEDIVILYDETLLDAKIDEPYKDGSATSFKAYITGKTVCETDFAICTADDVATLGEDATGYIIHIRKLDANAGRIVYVTSSGEKYHFSANCAGENAIKTTYFDAVGVYEPCGKCAK